MKREKLKFYWKWATNIILGILLVVMLVPSWRMVFKSNLQKWLMGSETFTSEMKVPLDFSQENWFIYDQNNQVYNFNEFKGKPIVLNFWATWCPTCRAEMPQIKKLNEKFDGEVQIISLSNEDLETIKKSGELNLNGDFIYFSPVFSRQFDFDVYPTTFIIDSDFNIVDKIEGAAKLDSEENIAFLKQL